jgi:hypothetical protein
MRRTSRPHLPYPHFVFIILTYYWIPIKYMEVLSEIFPKFCKAGPFKPG